MSTTPPRQQATPGAAPWQGRQLLLSWLDRAAIGLGLLIFFLGILRLVVSRTSPEPAPTRILAIFAAAGDGTAPQIFNDTLSCLAKVSERSPYQCLYRMVEADESNTPYISSAFGHGATRTARLAAMAWLGTRQQTASEDREAALTLLFTRWPDANDDPLRLLELTAILDESNSTWRSAPTTRTAWQAAHARAFQQHLLPQLNERGETALTPPWQALLANAPGLLVNWREQKALIERPVGTPEFHYALRPGGRIDREDDFELRPGPPPAEQSHDDRPIQTGTTSTPMRSQETAQ